MTSWPRPARRSRRATSKAPPSIASRQERASEEIAERIELEAQASDADVVVMGTHGRRGMRRLMLGSVAEGLIRVASRPVLLVRDK